LSDFETVTCEQRGDVFTAYPNANAAQRGFYRLACAFEAN